MVKVRKLSKGKGVLLVADLLFNGMERKEILQTIAKTCKVSDKTCDNWIKEAKIIALERQQHTNEIRERETQAIIGEAIKDGLKSNLEIEQRLLQIGWAEIDVEETTVTEQYGTTVFKRKPSPAEQRAALETVLKIRGGFAPTKVAQTDSEGKDVKQIDYSKISKEALKELLNAATES